MSSRKKERKKVFGVTFVIIISRSRSRLSNVRQAVKSSSMIGNRTRRVPFAFTKSLAWQKENVYAVFARKDVEEEDDGKEMRMTNTS